MCQQLEILDKIKKKGKVNGYGIELAEAQAKDFVMISKQVGLIKKDVVLIKKDNKKIFEMLARQGGQIDLIVKRLNSPVEEERKNGIFWGEIKKMLKTPLGRIILLLAIGCIALSGDKILSIFHLL